MSARKRRHRSRATKQKGGKRLIGLSAAAAAAGGCLIAGAIATAAPSVASPPSLIATTSGGTATRDCAADTATLQVWAKHIQLGSSYYEGEVLLMQGGAAGTELADGQTDASGDVTFSNVAVTNVAPSATSLKVEILSGNVQEGVNVPVTVALPSCQTAQKPTAKFTDTASNLKVDFDASGSTGTAPLSYAWAFGDGTTGSGVSPTHTYAKAGTYSVKLTVSNSAGSNSVTHNVTVTAAPPPPQCVTASKGNMNAQRDASGLNASVNPKVNVCATTLYLQEYAVSSKWDGNGFDASAVPQSRVAVDSKTVQGAGQVNFAVALDTTTSQYDYMGGCYVNRQTDLTNVDQPTIDKSGSHGILYTSSLQRYKVSDYPCGYVTPTPKDASGDFTLTGVCGLNNDVVHATAVNATAGAPSWNNGVVSVTFTANHGHLFPNGQPTLTVTKDEVDTSPCPTKTTAPPTHSSTPPGSSTSSSSAPTHHSTSSPTTSRSTYHAAAVEGADNGLPPQAESVSYTDSLFASPLTWAGLLLLLGGAFGFGLVLRREQRQH